MLGFKYYFFKFILPDILFTVLFLLLFAILKFDVEIYLSKGVIYFAVLFAFSDYILRSTFSGIEMLVFKTYTIKKMSRQEKFSIIIYPILRVAYLLLAAGLFILLLGIFKDYFYINSFYISLLIAGLILIIRTIVFRNYNMYRNGPDPRKMRKIKIKNEDEFRSKLKDLLENAPNDLDKVSDEEKKEVLGQMEDLLKQYMDPSDEENNEE